MYRAERKFLLASSTFSEKRGEFVRVRPASVGCGADDDIIKGRKEREFTAHYLRGRRWRLDGNLPRFYGNIRLLCNMYNNMIENAENFVAEFLRKL